MEVIDVEVADGKLNGTEQIALVGIPKWKEAVPKEKYWMPPLEDGMEVEPKIVVLGVIEGMEIVPPSCTEKGVCTLVALIFETMLPAVAIEEKDQYTLGLEGLWVGVPTYNRTSG